MEKYEVDPDEAKALGFKLSKNVSITDLLDDMRIKDASRELACRKASLREWLNEPIPESSNVEVDETAQKESINAISAALNTHTAAYALRFVKARQDKMLRNSTAVSDSYQLKDGFPSSIPVEIYLESLRELQSQKQHRKVDLFKEIRQRKAIKRRNKSFQRTVSRLKGPAERKRLNSASLSKRRNSQQSHSRTNFVSSNTPEFFESKSKKKSRNEASIKQSSKTVCKDKNAPAPLPFGTPKLTRPEPKECAADNDESEQGYCAKLHNAISEAITLHDLLEADEPFPSSAYPFGSPFRSRPLCRIYSSKKSSPND